MRKSSPETITDFICRGVRRRRNLACVRTLLSQHLDDDTIKQQKRILARFGLSVAISSVDATHFIADRFARTRNMLEAIVIGKPVVTSLWLESCGQAGCLIQPEICSIWNSFPIPYIFMGTHTGREEIKHPADFFYSSPGKKAFFALSFTPRRVSHITSFRILLNIRLTSPGRGQREYSK